MASLSWHLNQDLGVLVLARSALLGLRHVVLEVLWRRYRGLGRHDRDLLEVDGLRAWRSHEAALLLLDLVYFHDFCKGNMPRFRVVDHVVLLHTDAVLYLGRRLRWRRCVI